MKALVLSLATLFTVSASATEPIVAIDPMFDDQPIAQVSISGGMPVPGMPFYTSIEVKSDGSVVAEDRIYTEDMGDSKKRTFELTGLNTAELQNLLALGAKIQKGTLTYEQQPRCEDAPYIRYTAFNGTDILDIQREEGCVPHVLAIPEERAAADQIVVLLQRLENEYRDKAWN